jgi:hypothetical protein
MNLGRLFSVAVLLAALSGDAAPSRADILYAGRANDTITQTNTVILAGSTFAITSVPAPEGLAFDSSGNLFVAIFGSNMIEKFTPGGTGSVFETGTSSPVFLALRPAAVPEPSSLALGILGGLTMVASARDRRRRRAEG